MIFPAAGRGRPRKRHIPDAKSVSAKTMLKTAKWRKVSWRRGTKGPLSARFAAVHVRVADGPPQHIRDMGAQHLLGEEVLLVREHRSTGERKYYLSNMSSDTPIKQAKGEKRIAGSPPQPSLPAIRQAIIERLAKPPDLTCPQCGHCISYRSLTNLPKSC